jgi:hypothetical protein
MQKASLHSETAGAREGRGNLERVAACRSYISGRSSVKWLRYAPRVHRSPIASNISTFRSHISISFAFGFLCFGFKGDAPYYSTK